MWNELVKKCLKAIYVAPLTNVIYVIYVLKMLKLHYVHKGESFKESFHVLK